VSSRLAAHPGKTLQRDGDAWVQKVSCDCVDHAAAFLGLQSVSNLVTAVVSTILTISSGDCWVLWCAVVCAACRWSGWLQLHVCLPL
jgi:hypothetical protein